MPVQLDVSIPIGATGAVGTIAGPYVASVTRINTGMYQIQMQDNYSGYYLGGYQFISPVTGSDIAIDSVTAGLTAGKPYRITIVGANTDAAWRAIGVPAGVTIAVGVSFVAIATGSGASGAGRVKLVAAGSGIDKIELIGNPNSTIAPISAIGAGSLGAIASIQCLAGSIVMGAYTPTGTISTGVIPVAAGTAGDAVTNNAGVLNSTGGEDVSLNAQTFTGAAASLTGTFSYAAADPASGSTLKLSFLFSNSSVIIGGE